MAGVRTAGWLLALGATTPLAGAFTPPYEQWYAPVQAALHVIAAHPIGWRCIHVGFLAGTLLAAIGLAVFARALATGPGGAVATVSAFTFGLGSIFWGIDIALRLTVTTWAARELEATGSIPAVYAPLEAFAGVLFATFAVLAHGAIACVGWACLRSGATPRWIGWLAIVVGVAGAPLAPLSGPWVLYVPLLFVGVASISARRER